MNSAQLRHTITEYLSLIDDVSFLKAIKTIIETKASTNIYKLSDFEKNRIYQARENHKKYKSISQETLNNEIEEWLNSK